MKVLLLADLASIHTQRWANSLVEKNIDIYIFGLNKFDRANYNKKIIFETFIVPSFIRNKADASLSKIIYLASLRKISAFIKKIKPDILHAHYISSYGLLGSLIGFHPYIISVWGSDIYFVPRKNIINEKLIKFSLNRSDKILSTSYSMAKQIGKYTSKNIDITPFGINIGLFKPFPVKSLFQNDDIVIGTTKSLEKRYGNEYLIRAFKLVKDKLSSAPLKLLLVGGGTEENRLKSLVNNLGLIKDTIFTGFVSHNQIPDYYNMMDIYVALSTESESFGVSILEALSCEKPVIVSRVDGFVEIVQDNVNGIIVGTKNIEETAKAILKLVQNKQLRINLGHQGRKFVTEKYNWDKSINLMEDIYTKTISDFSG